MQKTICQPIEFTGIGLHSGRDVRMVMHSAPADHGIVFIRTDLENGHIPARWDMVTDTRLCTVISNAYGASVGTIEHVMAALRGCGVDNALIEIDAGEVPAMDGSAMPFVDLIDETGTEVQELPRRAIRILKEIRVEENGKSVSLRPAEGSIFSGEIDFDHPHIGRQRFRTQLLNGNFKSDLADSRTFGFLHDIEALKKAGLGLGGSLDNAVVLNNDSILNPDGLRHGDEFIRHKLLDAIGDLYLAGGRIIGAYDGFKGGHALNNALLRALFAQEDAFEMVDIYGDMTEAETIVYKAQQADSLAVH
ncbi:MAG: UDP-3-O-acyl-N-acetylglucosamine deacetylase [Alphaproteobacteria bacterium]